MDITLDGQPLSFGWSTFLILSIPGILYILYIVLYTLKLYRWPQNYLERKYNVKFVFRWRSFLIEGDCSEGKKFLIGILYFLFSFFLTFGPMVILAMGYYFLSEALVP